MFQNMEPAVRLQVHLLDTVYGPNINVIFLPAALYPTKIFCTILYLYKKQTAHSHF